MWADTDVIDDFAMPGDDDYNPANVAAVQEDPAAGAQAPLEAASAEAPGRARDEHGRFTSQQPEAEAEGGGPAEEPAADATVEDQPELILGKFRDPDALAAAYQNVEQEKGRLATDVGALRAEIAALREAQQPQPPQQAAQPQVDADAAREWLDQNPTRIPEALQQAYAQNNMALVAVALRAWEATGDEVGAEQARLAVATAQAARAMQEQTAAAERAQAQRDEAWNAEAQQFIASHPDFEQRAPAMQDIVAKNAGLAQLLSHNDPAVRAGALETVYTLAASGQPPAANLTVTAEEIARRQALAAEQAIKDATVASATASQTAPKSKVMELTEGWDTYEDPLAAGWNISPR